MQHLLLYAYPNILTTKNYWVKHINTKSTDCNNYEAHQSSKDLRWMRLTMSVPVMQMRTLQVPRTCVCRDTIMVMPRSETIIDKLAFNLIGQW